MGFDLIEIHAGGEPHIVKIQKPAGRAGSFTFDAAELCCCPAS
jgi:hypothetical protein